MSGSFEVKYLGSKDQQESTIRNIKACFLTSLGFEIDKIIEIMSATPSLVKQVDSAEEALKLRDLLSNAGADVTIEPEVPELQPQAMDNGLPDFDFVEAGHELESAQTTDQAGNTSSSDNAQENAEILFEFELPGQDFAERRKDDEPTKIWALNENEDLNSILSEFGFETEDPSALPVTEEADIPEPDSPATETARSGTSLSFDFGEEETTATPTLPQAPTEQPAIIADLGLGFDDSNELSDPKAAAHQEMDLPKPTEPNDPTASNQLNIGGLSVDENEPEEVPAPTAVEAIEEPSKPLPETSDLQTDISFSVEPISTDIATKTVPPAAEPVEPAETSAPQEQPPAAEQTTEAETPINESSEEQSAGEVKSKVRKSIARTNSSVRIPREDSSPEIKIVTKPKKEMPMAGIIVLGGFILYGVNSFIFKPGQESTEIPEITVNATEDDKPEVNPAAKPEVKTTISTEPEIEKTWEETRQNITYKLNCIYQAKEIVRCGISFTTPEPPPLTNREIAEGKVPDLWLIKFEADPVRISDGNGCSAGRTSVDDKGEKLKLAPEVCLQLENIAKANTGEPPGNAASQEEKKLTFRISYNTAPAVPGEQIEAFITGRNEQKPQIQIVQSFTVPQFMLDDPTPTPVPTPWEDDIEVL